MNEQKTKLVVAIDPGTTESALVVFSPDDGVINVAVKESNEKILRLMKAAVQYARAEDEPILAVEMIASYGMPVGREVFETCVWIGRFIEAWGGPHDLVYRKEVKLHLCNSVKAKDSNIRQALIDMFGGSKRAAIGLKASPGPLYGFSGDMWAALGVAVAYTKFESKQPTNEE